MIRLLPVCGEAHSLAAVTAAQRDPDPEIRDTAVRALIEWPETTAWSALVGTVRNATNNVHRSLAFNALARFAEEGNAGPADEAVGRHRVLMENARTDQDRRLALGALAGLAQPEALRLALPLLSDAAVHDEAALAVRKIAESIRKEHPQAAAKALQALE